MAFFSFSLLEGEFFYQSQQIQLNKKYYSKDITLWKELSNRNKKKQIFILKYESRQNVTFIGKNLLICLPPKFGLGDAIEYGIAIKSLIVSNKFSRVGVAYCGSHNYVFKNIFLFLDVYPFVVSEDVVKEYDTVFHITLEIESFKFQKYKRSNIASEICKYFNIDTIDFKLKKNNQINNFRKTISVFPISTSVIRSLPYEALEEITNNFNKEFQVRIIIDDSDFAKDLVEKNKRNNFKFVKPKGIQNLISEIMKTNFGIFVDSGPLHLAKIFDIKGVLIETSVSSKTLLTNSQKIFPIENSYKSDYCFGPCGLVDVFSYEKNVGCYETNKITFENIKLLKKFKNLQRWNKKEINSQFFSNPVGCVKKIDIKNTIELIKVKIKEY